MRRSPYSTPPMHRYLTSSHSSMPYFDPSRPRPDSLTPPNGATSVEMMQAVMPTMPYSSASAARQIRPMSRPQKYDASRNSVSLASAIASAASLQGNGGAAGRNYG